jgi:hypothetical protein
MSRANPTALRLGMSALFDGHRYTVAARVVCSVKIEGETYYWNEFRLVAGADREATLVFEETEDGPTWKWFHMFEPARPPSVAELESKSVRDTLNLGDGPARVTLAGRSQVYYGEGELPEGVEVGDVADYLNLELNGRMLVVSWTGGEIEYFTGRDLQRGYVERLFKLPRPVRRKTYEESSDYLGWIKFAAGALILVVFAVNAFDGFTRSPSEPPRLQPAPAVRLVNGARGELMHRVFRVSGHALVETARVNQRVEEHEYALVDSAGTPALLINGFTGRADHWLLLREVTPPAGFSGYQAAKLHVGQSINIEQGAFPVAALVLTRVGTTDGDLTADWRASTQYGWVARRDADWLIARWTEKEIRLYRGVEMADADVRSVLGSK